MRRFRFYLALWISKAVAIAIDIVAKGRGTNLPGAVALKIDPHFLKHIRGIDPEKTVFITGTNGKSTTTKLVAGILTHAGHRVIANLGGANMTAGVAVPLLRNCSLTGRLKCDYLVMETDERYVARIRKQLPARYLGITNIQKDQVQRNGEPSFIRDKIREALSPDMTVLLNRDEPNTLSLASAGAGRVLRYSVAPHARSFTKEDDFFAVTMPCPVCHSGLAFSQYNLDNVGRFCCPDCGFGSDTSAEYLTEAVSFDEKHFTLNGIKFPFGYNLPEYLYSHTLATAIALELGIPQQQICDALLTFEKNVGQREKQKIGSHGVNFFRIKQENSETLQSALNTIYADPSRKTVLFGLDEYIDFRPPYINGCYMFDCSFRGLSGADVEKCVCTSPALGHIGALRLLYDGVAPEKVRVLPDSLEKTLADTLDQQNAESIYLIEEIPFWKR